MKLLEGLKIKQLKDELSKYPDELIVTVLFQNSHYDFEDDYCYPVRDVKKTWLSLDGECNEDVEESEQEVVELII